MQRFIREEDIVRYEELLSWNVETGGEIEYELFYVEAEREPYEDALASVESIRWYEITPIDDGSFYVYICQEARPEDRSWREAYTALNLVVLPPVIYDADATFEMTLVGAGSDLRTLIERLPPSIDVSIHSVGTFDRRHETVATDCTERQFEAVRAAVELGYYDVPREGTLEEVSHALGCAESTASDLLRKAESSIMRRLVTRYRQ
ncbi:HTH DNA binding domain-containing protein [Haloferax mucosum ATCC BAA-1512]|uniref:HTH DNA binding domain-containing protein n=1 Tax=Haloferax mucosum ATCC BAA-1512 TaxID=662479 RepID=M0IRI2_9EURY|nr:helix-turn-helix domain-containing protein [Haloferax mucosum]ELZ98059.1 HTH DNA binding domain-containing protein [Haloferax mucosum ATCC BAA-1512]